MGLLFVTLASAASKSFRLRTSVELARPMIIVGAQAGTRGGIIGRHHAHALGASLLLGLRRGLRHHHPAAVRAGGRFGLPSASAFGGTGLIGSISAMVMDRCSVAPRRNT